MQLLQCDDLYFVNKQLTIQYLIGQNSIEQTFPSVQKCRQYDPGGVFHPISLNSLSGQSLRRTKYFSPRGKYFHQFFPMKFCAIRYHQNALSFDNMKKI